MSGAAAGLPKDGGVRQRRLERPRQRDLSCTHTLLSRRKLFFCAPSDETLFKQGKAASQKDTEPEHWKLARNVVEGVKS